MREAKLFVTRIGRWNDALDLLTPAPKAINPCLRTHHACLDTVRARKERAKKGKPISRVFHCLLVTK
jgi:hypothetical protein